MTVETYILLGGGIDSAALIPFYQSRGINIRGIHFNYGQPSAAGEQRAVSALSSHYHIPIQFYQLGISPVNLQGEYRCRNALLILAAASFLPMSNLSIAVGIHAGVPYYDCSRRFVEDTQRLLDGYAGGAIQIEAPFVDLSKRDIWEYCLANAVPVDYTFSCERQSHTPCGQCLSCQDREALRENH